ncbi:MAG: rRNA maturation RNase YbeY [Acidimicrobiia bacterium]|nr:rRNA maturation RNase YbeY [Acidimicrobiia bacterium]
MTVDVRDERAGASAAPDCGTPTVLDLDRWGRLAAVAAHTEGVRRPAEMGLTFVDEPDMAELAGAWLDSPHPTDVLAFPVDGSRRRAGRRNDGGLLPLLIGDVVVCPSVAARQAGEVGRPLVAELALLVVHGVLHLLGHDHAGRIESRRMDRRTRALLALHDRV